MLCFLSSTDCNCFLKLDFSISTSSRVWEGPAALFSVSWSCFWVDALGGCPGGLQGPLEPLSFLATGRIFQNQALAWRGVRTGSWASLAKLRSCHSLWRAVGDLEPCAGVFSKHYRRFILTGVKSVVKHTVSREAAVEVRAQAGQVPDVLI